MIFVLFSVICSVIVSIIIKIARNKQVNTKQLIVWNYPVAVLLTYFVLSPPLKDVEVELFPWNLYLPLAVLLPLIFVFIALAIEYSGIVKTEVAMRLSLFIPLIAAFVLFGETIVANRLVGILLGLLAILFSIGWHKEKLDSDNRNWVYALIVFFGMGIIDVLFKKVAQFTQLPYMTSMFVVFCLAMCCAFLYLVYLLVIKKQKLDVHAIWVGLILGIFNFGNILFYMKAHRAMPDNPSVVFTGMNIGVIALGAVVGVLFFKEKLTLFNKIGLILAIISVLFIAYL